LTLQHNTKQHCETVNCETVVFTISLREKNSIHEGLQPLKCIAAKRNIVCYMLYTLFTNINDDRNECQIFDDTKQKKKKKAKERFKSPKTEMSCALPNQTNFFFLPPLLPFLLFFFFESNLAT
jgi:hypothetical protein